MTSPTAPQASWLDEIPARLADIERAHLLRRRRVNTAFFLITIRCCWHPLRLKCDPSRSQLRHDIPVRLRDKLRNITIAFHDQVKRRRLHPSHR